VLPGVKLRAFCLFVCFLAQEFLEDSVGLRSDSNLQVAGFKLQAVAVGTFLWACTVSVTSLPACVVRSVATM
jgi:hypothetical protein